MILPDGFRLSGDLFILYKIGGAFGRTYVIIYIGRL